MEDPKRRMMGKQTIYPIISCCIIALYSGLFVLSSSSFADDLSASYRYWESKRFVCNVGAGPSQSSFPSSRYAPDVAATNYPCQEADMLLFLGLLCASGDQRGCDGVSDAQRISGQGTVGEWYRSPYQRMNPGNWGGGAQISPDHVLGIELYLIAKHDVTRANLWLRYLDRINKCALVDLDDNCRDPTPPRFTAEGCTSGLVTNCTIRPGDAAILYETMLYLKSQGLEELPKSSRLGTYLRLMDNAITRNQKLYDCLSGLASDPGYPTHLGAATVYLMRLMGKHDFDSIIDGLLSHTWNTGNVFLEYLHDPSNVTDLRQHLIQSCPIQTNDFHLTDAWEKRKTPASDTWHWQNANTDADWVHSNYWDCIFAAHLLGLPEPVSRPEMVQASKSATPPDIAVKRTTVERICLSSE
jgi:hypothetical protein